LDEPTATLDDKGQALVAAMVGAHVASGGTVMAATHHDIDLPPGRVSSTLNLAGP
ncbi:MAG: hypothetical protein GXP01_03735, partial [Alphaproteobacteria bacterium]|nr:hypothetical protein [Alphaproteobacteria bacterium]